MWARFLRDCRHCPAFLLRANQTVSVHIPAVEVTSLKLFNQVNNIAQPPLWPHQTITQAESMFCFHLPTNPPSCHHAALLLIYNLPPLFPFLCWGRLSADWDAAGGKGGERRVAWSIAHFQWQYSIATFFSGNTHFHFFKMAIHTYHFLKWQYTLSLF